MLLEDKYYIATKNFMRRHGYRFVCLSVEFDMVFCNKEKDEIQLVNILDYWPDTDSSPIINRSEFEKRLQLFYFAGHIPEYLIDSKINYTEIGFIVDEDQPDVAVVQVHWNAY